MARRVLSQRIVVDDSWGDDLIAHALNTSMLVWTPYLYDNAAEDFTLIATRYADRIAKTAQKNMKDHSDNEPWIDIRTGQPI